MATNMIGHQKSALSRRIVPLAYPKFKKLASLALNTDAIIGFSKQGSGYFRRTKIKPLQKG